MAGLRPQDTRPRVTGGQGGTDYFDTIIPGGGMEKNNIQWQQGLRRAFTRGRSYFEHFLKRGGVAPDMIGQHVSDLYTGSPSDRKQFLGMAEYGGYHGHKARYDQMSTQRAQPTTINQPGLGHLAQQLGVDPGQLAQIAQQLGIDPGQAAQLLSTGQLSRFGYTRPSAHAQNRLGAGGPAYRAGSWEDTQRINHHPQHMGGYGPGGMIKPGLGMGGYGPNFGPRGKLNPNIGRRIGDTHYSPQHMGGYGPGGMINPNAPPGHVRGKPLLRRR